jgi:dihydrofolate reductase
MRTLSLVEFLTLDGVMQSFGSPDEDRDGGFEYGGWGAPYADRSMFEATAASLSADLVYLFGRRTYQKMQAGWENQPADNPMAAHLNGQPKYVATRTLTEVTWNNTRILDGDLVPAVRKLKEEGDGAITVLGSGELAQELIANDLVDGYTLFVHPLVLGTGKRLLREYPRPQRLRLTGCTPSSTGVLVVTYETE